LTPEEIKARLDRVRQVMKTVMREGEHYGIIPGCKKPSLYKAGAEILNVTFRLSARVAQHEDLSTEDEIKHRFRVEVYDPKTEVIWGDGLGECSSDEQKYKWRETLCPEEWEQAPEDRRRLKYKKRWDRSAQQYVIEAVQQIRTELADVANTVLKLGHKRAYVHATIQATAASDIFTQDLEDIPPENLGDEEGSPAKPKPGPRGGGFISEPQRKRPFALLYKGATDDKDRTTRTDSLKAFMDGIGIQSTTEIPKGSYELICGKAEEIAGA